jgi:hypothetical protein
VIAQDQKVFRAEIDDQARLFVLVERDAFVIVIGERRERKKRLLRERQQTVLLGRHRDAVERMNMQEAGDLVPRGVNRAVDRKAGRVDEMLGFGNDLAR